MFSRFFGTNKEDQTNDTLEAKCASFIIPEDSIGFGGSKDRPKVTKGTLGNFYIGAYNDIACFLKIFNSNDYKQIERRLLEVQIAMKLRETQHVRIIQFFGLWFDRPNKHYTLILEPFETTLSEYLTDLSKKNKISLFKLKDKILILYDVARAMVFLHNTTQIVHGDLRASNIVLKKEGSRVRLIAKVCDFSKATFINSGKELPPPLNGSDEIMPPEALKKYDNYVPKFEVDTFSFGCLIIHVGVCRSSKPINISSSEYERRRHCIQELKGRNFNFLDPLIKQCLANSPAERGSFADLETKLSNHLRELKVNAEEVNGTGLPVPSKEKSSDGMTPFQSTVCNPRNGASQGSNAAVKLIQTDGASLSQTPDLPTKTNHTVIVKQQNKQSAADLPNIQHPLGNPEDVLHFSQSDYETDVQASVSISDHQIEQSGTDAVTGSQEESTGEKPHQESFSSFFYFKQNQISLSNPQKIEEQGSFGAIYYGTLTKADSTQVSCAVKVFNEGTNSKREVDIARKLSKAKGHSCVVTFYGTWPSSVSTPSQTMSLVMERCHKSNLYDYLKEKKENNKVAIFSLKEKLTLIHDVARGMEFIHSLGIVHGDLHATNVLLVQMERGFRAKVADFGSSVDISNGDLVKDCGKKEFMPPEVIAQLKNSECQLTRAVDVFSFGCLMIHVATCRFPKPEEGGTSAYSSRKYLIEEIKGIQKEALQPIIQQLLSEKPEARGSFHLLLSNHGQLSCLLERYREEKAEALEEKTGECDKLRSQVRVQEKENNKIRQEKEELQMTSEGTIERLEMENSQLKDQVTDLKSEIVEKDKEILEKDNALTQEKYKCSVLENLQTQQNQAMQGIGPVMEKYKEANIKNIELEGKLTTAKNELTEAKKQNEKLKGECTKFQKEVDQALSSKQTEERLHTHTKEQLSKQKATHSDLLQQFKESQQQKKEAEEKIKELKEQVEALENIKDSISKDLEETRNKKKELSKKFTQAKAQEGKLEQEKADLIAQLTAMQGQKVVVQEERDNLKHNKESLSTEVMQLQSKLDVQQTELRKSEAEINSLSEKLNRKCHELQEVEQKFGERDKEAKELEESKKKVLNLKEELKQEIERLEADNMKVNSELERVKLSHRNLQTKVNTLETEKTGLLNKKKNLEEKVAAMGDEKEELNSELRVRKKDIREKDDEIGRLEERLKVADENSVLMEKNEELERTNGQLKNKLEKYQEQIQEGTQSQDSLLYEVSRLKTLLQEKEAEINKLSGMIVNVEECKRDLEKSLDEQKIDLEEKNKKLEASENEAAMLRLDRDTLKDLQRAHKRMRKREMDNFSVKIQELQDKSKKMEEDCAQLKVDLDASEKNYHQALARYREEKKQRRILEKQIIEYQHQIEKMKEELSKLQDELKNKGVALDESNAYLCKLVAQNKLLEGKIENLKVELAECKQKLLCETSELAKKKTELEDISSELLEVTASCKHACAENRGLETNIEKTALQNAEEVTNLKTQLKLAYQKIKELEENFKAIEDEIKAKLEGIEMQEQKLLRKEEAIEKLKMAVLSDKRRNQEKIERLQSLALQNYTGNQTKDEHVPVYVSKVLAQRCEILEGEKSELESAYEQEKRELMSCKEELSETKRNFQQQISETENYLHNATSSLYRSHQYPAVLVLMNHHCKIQSTSTFGGPSSAELAQVVPLESLSTELHWPLLKDQNLCLHGLFQELQTVSKDPISGYGVISITFIHYGERVDLYRFHIFFLPTLLSQDGVELKGLIKSDALVVYGKCSLLDHMATGLSKITKPTTKGVLFKPTTSGVVPNLTSGNKLMMTYKMLVPVSDWLDKKIDEALKSSFSRHCNPLDMLEASSCITT